MSGFPMTDGRQMQDDILEKLEGLAKQASSEKSHYYVAATVGEAHREIVRLRAALEIFAQCDLNADNCASLEVATRRIKALAHRALAGK